MPTLFKIQTPVCKGAVFLAEANLVFEADKSLWVYYHVQEFSVFEPKDSYKANPSLYEIREHFQSRSEGGKMNNKSLDGAYTGLIGRLQKKPKHLAGKIELKVYEYGFLKE